jgi:hypothetical protein
MIPEFSNSAQRRAPPHREVHDAAGAISADGKRRRCYFAAGGGRLAM